MGKPSTENRRTTLPKVQTGIAGLDDITEGGLPKGRATLVCGTAGAGKTIFALEFLVRGATQFDDPGVFLAFEETRTDIAANVTSLGFDIEKLTEEGALVVDFVDMESNDIYETGGYSLDGLFIRLESAIDAIGAKRVAIDTLEVLFTTLKDTRLVRSELRRLFRWLKDKGVTAIITAEQGQAGLTRYGLEEYVSDCVIALEHSPRRSIYTRHVRIVKYRGSHHETDDFPFLIDEDGISILPVTSLALEHQVSDERISTGIAGLDAMLGGRGFFRGSSVLISGTAGTGKTSLVGHFALTACRRGERVLYLSLEESEAQVIRNLTTIGVDLAEYARDGLLVFQSSRVQVKGLEGHLTAVHRLIEKHSPAMVIVDPVNAYLSNENEIEVRSMLIRLIDFLKSKMITGAFTNLTTGTSAETDTDVSVSSLMDAWLLLREIETNGERNRGLYVLKARGIANSNQIREFSISGRGIELDEVYVGTTGVLAGTSRKVQEQLDRDMIQQLEAKIASLEEEIDRRRQIAEAQIELARYRAEADERRIKNQIDESSSEIMQTLRRHQTALTSRQSDRGVDRQ